MKPKTNAHVPKSFARLGAIVGLIPLVICCGVALAEPVKSLPSNRVEINFNPDWKFAPGDQGDADFVEYSDADWEYVDLPHSTKFVTPDNPNATLGESWYRKHFVLDQSLKGKKIYIQFEAAMQQARVWVNGKKVGQHVGGYTGFTFDITDAVKIGEQNLIAVWVTTTRTSTGDQAGTEWIFNTTEASTAT